MRDHTSLAMCDRVGHGHPQVDAEPRPSYQCPQCRLEHLQTALNARNELCDSWRSEALMLREQLGAAEEKLAKLERYFELASPAADGAVARVQSLLNDEESNS